MLSCLQLFTTQMFTEKEPNSLFLCFLWNYCLLINSLLSTGPRGSLRQTLFMTHLRADSELSREKLGIIPLQKQATVQVFSYQGGKLLWHLRCCSIFFWGLNIISFQGVTAAVVPSTQQPALCWSYWSYWSCWALSTRAHCRLGQKISLEISTSYLPSRSSSLLFMLVHLSLKQTANNEIQGARLSNWVSLLYTGLWASSYFFIKFSLASN